MEDILRKTVLLFLMILLFFTSTPVFSASNEDMIRKSDEISQDELQELDRKTEEAISELENNSEIIMDGLAPKVFTIYGWFEPNDKSRVSSNNAILSNSETRAIIGTPNSGSTLETIKIYTNDSDLVFKYKAKLAGEDWQDEQTGLYDLSQAAGNVETDSKKISNLIIRLSGSDSTKYDLYYRVYIRNQGWQDWVGNNVSAIPEDTNEYFESLEVRLLPKGSPTPLNTTETQDIPLILATGYVQNLKPLSPIIGKTLLLGSTNTDIRLEGFSLKSYDSNFNLRYQSFISSIGWQEEKVDGDYSGGQGLESGIEAIKINIDGEASQNYDIYYRTYVDLYGWLDWANNGQISGTTNQSLKIKAIQIRILPKGSNLPGETEYPSIQATSVNEGEFLKQLNTLRLKKKLPLITGIQKLQEAAEVRLEEIVENYNHLRKNNKGFESILDEIEYREDNLVPALAENITKTSDINKAFENFQNQTNCLNTFNTDYYKYLGLAFDEETNHLVVLLSDTPNSYEYLY